MTDVVLAAVLGVLGGVVLTVLLLLARRLARGAADLGSDAERAALTALHHASLAAPHLRAGLAGPDVVKAARHLRVLLGSAAVAIVDADGTLSFDGPSDGLESAAVRIAEQVTASGRRQVFPSPGADDDLEGVGAPILVDGRVIGAVVAFAAPVRASLVRAAEEVADWCAAQVELGDLDSSRTQLAEAELRSLRAQISPHFIYNALTAIASFIHTDPVRARPRAGVRRLHPILVPQAGRVHDAGGGTRQHPLVSRARACPVRRPTEGHTADRPRDSRHRHPLPLGAASGRERRASRPRTGGGRRRDPHRIEG
ncbi:hypothetical protein JOF42_001031 [Microbacterium phyllosphaerae]|uniref:Signal transduction histidine kinase internal region domain-containing protein n=1 Tax=Microbacterium phyllosphaerae TaxID=124798 RepID=A0ABS4WMV7_9MICO|nr:hypothetical protein [Microbacterium phyllosphaerae]